MINITSTVKLTLKGPILTSGGGDMKRGLNKVFYKNSLDEPVLQASHIKGKLREALNELNEVKAIRIDLNKLFGKENAAGIYRPQQGILHFSDFELTLDKSTNKNAKLTRVSINKITGTSQENFLQIIENLFESGRETVWQGNIAYSVQSESEADEIKQYLLVGFKWITGFGSSKGTGLGRLRQVQITPNHKILNASLKSTPQAGAKDFHIKIELIDDLLVGGVHRSTNFVESEKIISGAVIKGSLAACLNRFCGTYPLDTPIDSSNAAVAEKFPELAAHFSEIRFTHAFPCPPNSKERAVVIPLSSIKTSKKEFADVALVKEPTLDESKKAPSFQVDWKNRKNDKDEYIDTLFGWADLRIINKTRTAILSNLRSAMRNKLYTFQYFSPFVSGENGNSYPPPKNVWLANVSLPDLDPNILSQLANELFQVISEYWIYVGKRQSRIAANWGNGLLPQKVASKPLSAGDAEVVIALQSDAVILNPDDFSGNDNGINLEDAYRRYWEKISKNSLTMSDFYASQRLLGGYLFHRYPNQGDYYPYFLTSAGSVFILKVKDQNSAKHYIENWSRHGLSLPEWVNVKYPNKPLWKEFPFVPENGFGEIAVNLSWHWDKKLTETR